MPITVLLLLLTSRAFAQDGRTAPREWGKQAGSFRISISADKDRYGPSEIVRVKAVLKNVADHPSKVQIRRGLMYKTDVRLAIPDWLPWKAKTALTKLGRDLDDPAIGGVMGGEIKAGTEIVREVELNKIFDMSVPGDYRATFSCRQPLRDFGDTSVVVTSNEITVTILKAPEKR